MKQRSVVSSLGVFIFVFLLTSITHADGEPTLEETMKWLQEKVNSANVSLYSKYTDIDTAGCGSAGGTTKYTHETTADYRNFTFEGCKIKIETNASETVTSYNSVIRRTDIMTEQAMAFIFPHEYDLKEIPSSNIKLLETPRDWGSQILHDANVSCKPGFHSCSDHQCTLDEVTPYAIPLAKYMSLFVKDQEMGQRIVNALRHAKKLCGDTSKKELF